MPYKVVQTIEKGKPVLTAVPHSWEKDGTLFWPKNQADKLIKVEDICPEDNWIPIPCELKINSLNNYEDAQTEINSMLYKGVGGQEQNNRDQAEPTSSRSGGHTVELKIEQNSQDPLVFDEQAPAALSAGMELILENQRIMLENQKKMMRKINDFSAKLDILMSRRSYDGQCSNVNEQDSIIHPIDSVEALDDLENDLKDPEKRNNLHKRYSVICQGKGEGVTCAYFLIDVLFTRQFMTKCSWSGGSRGEAKVKIPFKFYNNVIHFFHTLIHDCDQNFSLVECHNFFKAILKNSLQRSESRRIRSSAKRTRLSKHLSQIRMTFVSENDDGDEFEESRDVLDESGSSASRKKKRRNSDMATSEGETDGEKELNESDGYIRDVTIQK